MWSQKGSALGKAIVYLQDLRSVLIPLVMDSPYSSIKEGSIMNRQGFDVLLRSTLITVGVISGVLWGVDAAAKSGNSFVLIGHQLTLWPFVVYSLALERTMDGRMKVTLHPSLQILCWFVEIVGIYMATNGWTFFYPTPWPWVISTIMITVASRDGWQWLWGHTLNTLKRHTS